MSKLSTRMPVIKHAFASMVDDLFSGGGPGVRQLMQKMNKPSTLLMRGGSASFMQKIDELNADTTSAEAIAGQALYDESPIAKLFDKRRQASSTVFGGNRGDSLGA